MTPGPEVVVVGDAERLTQVAHNLVGNALTHTPRGSRVVVSTNAERGMGVIRVTDNGPGIDPAIVSRAFDRFSRGDPARVGPGTGLGLAIVRAIAEALGGTAEATTAPGGGATMIVRIPLAPVQLRPAARVSASELSLRGPVNRAQSPT
jgi:two-component system OmpR family sensor kinase